MGLTYNRDVGPGHLNLGATLYFTSSYANDIIGVPPGTAYPGRPGVPAGVTTSQLIWTIPSAAYKTVGLTGSYTLGPWQVSAYVNNLFNKQYIASAAGNFPYQLASAVAGEPRTYEVTLRREF